MDCDLSDGLWLANINRISNDFCPFTGIVHSLFQVFTLQKFLRYQKQKQLGWGNMNRKKYNHGILLIAVSLILSSCNIFGSDSGSDGTDPLGGELSSMGAVGNTFGLPSISGTSDMFIGVIEREGSVSTIQSTVTLTNPTYLEIAKAVESSVSSMQVNGNDVSLLSNIRITSEGIQNVYENGNKSFSLVEYDAKVGDTYKIKLPSGTVTRKVTKKSTEDDYFWGFMNIKVIEVEETSPTPGITKVVYYANHRFGLVGVDVHFEDGSKAMANIYSDN